MMSEGDRARGMTLIEVTMALFLLVLVALLISSSALVMSRNEIGTMEDRARANVLATRIIESYRARVRASSFRISDQTPEADPASWHPQINQSDETNRYLVDVLLTPGSVENGYFEARSALPGTGAGSTFAPGPSAAVRIVVTLSWPVSSANHAITRESIFAP